MSTITIETSGPTSRRFEIDLSKEPKEFVREIQKLMKKLEARSAESASTEKLSPKLERLRKHIDQLSDRPESRAALAEADEIRKDWIRKHE